MTQENISPHEINPIGTLFDSINYFNNSDLEKFISQMTTEQAMYCLIQACQSAYERKSFSLLESEVLSKALRMVTTEKKEE